MLEDCPDDDTLVRFHLGQLSDDECASFEAHLAACPECCGLLATAFSAAPEFERLQSRYELLEQVGRGSQGVVYRAMDHELERQVALKVFDLDAETDETSRAARLDRMRKEAQCLAQLSHPRIVPVYEVGTLGGHAYISMQWVDGNPLSQWAANRSGREVLKTLTAVGSALSAAHRSRVLHRDLKPSNILVDDDGLPTLVDFGLATVTHDVAQSSSGTEASPQELTTTRSRAGTPLYMAPEQHDGAPASLASDQYSLCVVMYEALVGLPPFVAATAEQVADLKKGGLECWAELTTRVPSRVARAIARGLRPHPEDRWESVAALVETLERSRRGLRWDYAVAGLAAAGLLVSLALSGSRPLPSSRAVADDCPAFDLPLWTESDRELAATRLRPDVAAYLETNQRNYLAGLDQRYDEACTRGNDRVMECLREQAKAVGDTLARLPRAPEREVPGLRKRLERLARPSLCDDSDGLVAPGAAYRESVRTELDEILWRFGDYRQSDLERTTELLSRARAAGEVELVAEAWFTHARVLKREFRSREAYGAYQEAFHAAAESNWPHLALTAALYAADAAIVSGDPEAGRRWLRLTEAWFERAGDDPALRAHAWRVQARVAEPRESERLLRRAVEQYGRLREPKVVATLHQLAIARLAAQDAQGAQQALEEARSAVPDGGPGPWADAFCLEAAVANLQDRFEDRNRLQSQCVDAWTEVAGNLHHQAISARVNFARFLLWDGRVDEAERQLAGILDRLESTPGQHHWLLEQLRAVLGRVLVRQGRTEGGLALFRRNLAELEVSQDLHGYARALQEIALALIEIDEYVLARRHLLARQGVLRELNPGEPTLEKALNQEELAMALQGLGKLEEARQACQIAVDILDRVGPVGDRYRGSILVRMDRLDRELAERAWSEM